MNLIIVLRGFILAFGYGKKKYLHVSVFVLSILKRNRIDVGRIVINFNSCKFTKSLYNGTCTAKKWQWAKGFAASEIRNILRHFIDYNNK